MRERTGGGVHYSFEALGLKATAEQSFGTLRPGGTATIIGMIPFGTTIELHGFDFLRERKIQGSSMGGTASGRTCRGWWGCAPGQAEAGPPDQQPYREPYRAGGDQGGLCQAERGKVVRQVVRFD